MPIDRTNLRYGRVVAQRPCGKNAQEQIVWLCVCDCGTLVYRGDFSKNKSCGCLSRDTCSETGKKNKGQQRPSRAGQGTRHGGARRGKWAPEYKAYCAAKNRCENSKHARYADWGGRGIQFKFASYEDFLTELGPKPTLQHSIDRWPNNDGHYEPGNVRWATAQEQANNKRPRCQNRA